MFRPTSPQSSFFEVENCIPEALPKDDWCFIYKEKILPLIDEEKFRHLYSARDGRPNASITVMISLLIFMGLERLTWRAVEFLFLRRIDWLVATNTPIGEAKIDHTTLFKFYLRLEGNSICRELFTELTDFFMQACGTSIAKQRTDSFFIHGWLRILSRYGLFKETIRKFLQVLRKQKPGHYRDIAKELSQDYLGKEFDLTEKDRELAQKKVSLMARDLYRLYYAFKDHKQVQHYETFIILCKVFNQQCEVKENTDGTPEIIIKEKPDPDTICTPHNPEARYVRKGKQKVTGDKAFVTETCSPENKTQFITDCDHSESTCADPHKQEDIQMRLIENEFKPEQQYADAGFVNGQTIISSQENGINLEGATAGRSQSFESYNERPLDASDFDTNVDQDTHTLVINRCPNGQAPVRQNLSGKTGKLIVHFDPKVCNSCPKREQCPVKIGQRVSTYMVSEEEYVGAVRHNRYMGDKNYRKECAIRAGVEATVSELTRAHGVRKSRHRKHSRTKLQLLFAVIACNVKRFIRHGQKYGYSEAAAQPA